MKIKIILLLVCFASMLKAQELDSLLVWSAKNHPTLKAAFLKYQASLEAVHGTGYLPEPTLSFGYFISSPETRLGPQIGSVGLQQLFPWRGTLKAQQNIAVSKSKMQFERFNLLRIKLLQEVKQLYFEAENRQTNVQLVNENIMLLEQVKSIGLANVASGNGSTTDVLRLNLKIDEMQTMKRTSEIQFKGKMEQLGLLTGKADLSLEFNFENTLVSLNDTITNHPMIAMVQERLAMNEAQKRIITQKALPKLGFGVHYTIVNERTDMNPVNNGRDVLMPKLSMTLPIYRKKYRALSKMNQLEKESLHEEIAGVQLDLNSKLVMVLTQINSEKERIGLFEKQIGTTQTILKILQSDYESGATSIESILSTQVQLIHFQLETEKAKKGLRVAKSQLEFLLNKKI
jgi:cobalt-zinc-cadmium efflux system outer membrane protein